MRTILFIFLFVQVLTFSVHSQCSEITKIPYTDGSYGEYKGCLNDSGKPSGIGFLKTDDFTKDGEWESGKLNGQAKLISLKDNSIYEGLWKDDKLINGNYMLISDDASIKYKGDFENFKFQGQGVLEIFNPDYSIIKEGEFFNNDLFEGKSLVVWNNGLTIDSFIDRGKVISEKRNDVNYYNPDDIIGDNEFTIINLKKDGIENEGISYNVEMEINGVKGEWIFDTGAESFSIGQRLFKRLVKEGVKYRDLKRTVKTFGVGGESTGRLIIIDDLKIGGYIINNVVVKIANDNNFSLLGMGFLNKFNDVEWSMKKKKLKLIK